MIRECYECVHKGSAILSGHHSECRHPLLKDSVSKFMALGVILTGRKVPLFEFTANKHGLEHGWFNWPLNYDPIWMDGHCLQFKQKEKQSEEAKGTSGGRIIEEGHREDTNSDTKSLDVVVPAKVGEKTLPK